MQKYKQVPRSIFNLLSRATPGAVVGTLSIPMLLVSTQAHALKGSDLAMGWKAEMAAIAPVWLLGVMAIGICIAGWAAISGVLAKKNQEPLKWQLFGVVGGAIAIVIPVVLLAFAGSLSDERGNAEGVMSELNIRY